jgi:glycosyltransferase involved in cell wall biosynthesis
VSATISVLLPVFNGEKYLANSIKSVLGQTHTDFELLIGDDASTDSGMQILKNFEDPRIHVQHRSSNGGLFQNLNGLLGQARAPIIRFLCQDDAIDENCLAEELAFFKAHPMVGMTFCKTTRVNDANQVVGRCELNDLPNVIAPNLAIQLLYYFGCLPGNLSTVCVRKECVKTVGYFNESFGAASDYELWSRVCERYPLGVIHQRLVRLRQHQDQLTYQAASALEHIRGSRSIRENLLKKMPSKIRTPARRYTILRQDALDAHHVFVSATRGRFGHALRAIQAIGISHASMGVLSWILTINNRAYKPKACLDVGTSDWDFSSLQSYGR